ncbi:glutathione ABC transporter, ATP-binding protein GsiA [Bordetella pertussis H918]|uniref:ABC transporter ATP-binding protein n=1 Tax=Bordetella pertussis TaxID=520 RepID=UPI0003D3E89C|nr:ABC transporter ATP-binding protein [Bordetella pertussis]ETH41091.1 glutathione ABC transporter, ATP-binding protein GsiA [Bordetella pertussis H918]ETH62488.1 glutathione ABC transporter, ATP-binding protein GsiA [Bordetella pertussis I176]
MTTTTTQSRRVLELENLSIAFGRGVHTFHAVKSLSLHVDRGETLAIVGESGSGKSVTSLAVMRLVEFGGGRIESGRMTFYRGAGEAVDLAAASEDSMRAMRGNDLGMIFQEPMTSLNPVFTVGAQIVEAIRLHQACDARAAQAAAKRILDQVRIPDSASILGRYPHELSGGMRQRVMIAMALSCKPALLIADEPTTALDVSIQAQIVNLLIDLQRDLGVSYLFISHDMAVVERISHRVAVMYLGQIVEIGPRQAIFENPQHPYTKKLMQAVPIADPGARRSITLELSELPSPARPVGDEPVVKLLEQAGPGHFVARHRIGGAY